MFVNLWTRYFGAENFLVTIFMRKKGSQRGNEIRPINDWLLWYCKDKTRIKRRFLYTSKMDAADLSDEFEYIEYPDSRVMPTSSMEIEEIESAIAQGARLYTPEPLHLVVSIQRSYSDLFRRPHLSAPAEQLLEVNEAGINRIIDAGRLHVGKGQVRFKKFHTDFPFVALNNLWADMAGATGRRFMWFKQH